ncbi:MAG: hypothetical protein GY773_28850, partial [Actinomycetia bacterium]|nr:hypothetical protein [Actinomycetes bacterium]
LAVGPMHVVAPLTAITSAMVPAAHGVVSGEQLAVIAWLGIGTGLVAIGLVSSSSVDHDETAPVTPQALIESLLAGVGFGTMFILLDATDPGSAPWPIVGARIVTGLGLTAVLLVIWVWGRQETLFPTDPRTWRLIAIAGLLDTMANVGFLYATGRGALAEVMAVKGATTCMGPTASRRYNRPTPIPPKIPLAAPRTRSLSSAEVPETAETRRTPTSPTR